MRSSRVAVLMGAVSVVAGMLLGEIPTGQAATGPVVVSAPAAPAGDSLTVQSFNDYGPVSGTSSAPGETVIPVSGMPSTITDLSVYLRGLNVHALSDAHVTLVTPDGTAVDLIELACFGSSAPVVDHDFIVDDRAASPLPHDAADSSDSCWSDRGVIQPSDYIFALPSEPTRLAAVNGHAANGDWKIRVSSHDSLPAGLSGGFGFILAADDPDTVMTAGPGNGAQSGSSVSFGFASNIAAASFDCDLDGTAFPGCIPPFNLTGLRAGSHTFQVDAKTRAGYDPSAARVEWTVAAPDTRITQHPKRRTTRRRATFAFTATEAGSRFGCKLYDRPWRACPSPKLVLVEPGRHVFQVRAIDPAGNRDQTPAKAVWRRTRR